MYNELHFAPYNPNVPFIFQLRFPNDEEKPVYWLPYELAYERSVAFFSNYKIREKIPKNERYSGPRRKIWYVDWSLQGEHIRKDFKNKKDAEDWLSEIGKPKIEATKIKHVDHILQIVKHYLESGYYFKKILEGLASPNDLAQLLRTYGINYTPPPPRKFLAALTNNINFNMSPQQTTALVQEFLPQLAEAYPTWKKEPDLRIEAEEGIKLAEIANIVKINKDAFFRDFTKEELSKFAMYKMAMITIERQKKNRK